MPQPPPAPSDPHHAALRGGLLITLLALAAPLTACDALTDAATDRAQILARHTCAEGQARVLNPVGPWIGCDDGAWLWLGGQWRRQIEGAAFAALPSGPGREAMIVALSEGRFALVKAGAPVRVVKAPRLKPPKGGPFYSWRPPGLADAPDDAVTSLHAVDSGRVLAVTAGNGALISEDDGESWAPTDWNGRFTFLNGSFPLELRDLIATETGRLAFLIFPEGEQIAREQFEQLMSRGAEDTTEGGGPVIATGFLTDQRLEVRAVPIGTAYHLIQPPKEGRQLWLYVGHSSRNETTRYQSMDWGKKYLDTGYYDFQTIAAAGSGRRAAMLGLDDQGRGVVLLRGLERAARFAHVDLPEGEGPLALSVEDVDLPAAMALARGQTAVAYDLSGVDLDARLLWIYVPIGVLLPLLLTLMLRRLLVERRLARAWEQARATPGLGTEVDPDDLDGPPPPAWGGASGAPDGDPGGAPDSDPGGAEARLVVDDPVDGAAADDPDAEVDRSAANSTPCPPPPSGRRGDA